MEDKEKTKKSLQDNLSDKLMNTFDSVINEKQKYYQQNDKPTVNDIKNLISTASNKNALISGGASLIPGPWGMLAAIPEIVLIIRNQTNMIYDIGIAYGKEKIMNKELLAGIALMAMGTGGIGLLTMHGGKYLVKRSSLQFFQKIVKIFAGKTTQQLLKSSIAKWLPVVGAAAMATWAKYSTNAIGKKAVEILSKDIEFEQRELSESNITEAKIIENNYNSIFDENKIYSLINLMKVDKQIHEKELEYINELIDNSVFEVTKKGELKKKIHENSIITVDYSIFKNNPDESVGLIVDLIALAKRDNDFHPAEKLFIKQVSKQVGFDENELTELLN